MDTHAALPLKAATTSDSSESAPGSSVSATVGVVDAVGTPSAVGGTAGSFGSFDTLGTFGALGSHATFGTPGTPGSAGALGTPGKEEDAEEEEGDWLEGCDFTLEDWLGAMEMLSTDKTLSQNIANAMAIIPKHQRITEVIGEGRRIAVMSCKLIAEIHDWEEEMSMNGARLIEGVSLLLVEPTRLAQDLQQLNDWGEMADVGEDMHGMEQEVLGAIFAVVSCLIDEIPPSAPAEGESDENTPCAG